MFTFIICFLAGIGAGLGTGFAGMSAAAVISPMLITFLDMDVSLASPWRISDKGKDGFMWTS